MEETKQKKKLNKMGKTVMDIEFGEVARVDYDDVMNTLTLIFDPEFDEHEIPEDKQMFIVHDSDYLINDYSLWTEVGGYLLKISIFHFSHKGPKFLNELLPGIDWAGIRKEVLKK